MEFTCLTKEQIKDLFNVGDQLYNPVDNKGIPSAYITDFAIFLGGSAIAHKKNRLGSWCSQVLLENLVAVISTSNTVIERDINKISGSSIRVSINTSNMGGGNWKFLSKKGNSILVTYGEMPQDKVWCGSPLEKALASAYSSNTISYTGKVYKFYYQKELVEFKEFSYECKKYIVADQDFRKKIKHPYNDSSFSDGSHAEKVNSPIFFQVKPVEWVVNTENEIAYTDKLLFPSFPITFQNGEFFENTNLYKFLNEEFRENIANSLSKITKIEAFDLEINPNLDEIRKIKSFIETDIPVFLHGKSGDGKSARVKQLDPDCIILYMRNATPESLIGKSIVNSGKEGLIDIPPTWYLKLLEKCQREPDKLHILFFDELTNALPSIQSMAFNIVLKKEVNGKWKLPENVRIIAAGNEINDSLAANELAEPLYGRFAHIFINTEIDNWCMWALENNIHPLIVAFIKLKGLKVLRSKFTGEKPNADPRKWEMASRMLYQTNNPYMLKCLIGSQITKEFINFLALQTYQLDDVVSDDFIADKMSKDEKYLTAYTLSFANLEDFEKVYKFMQTLGEGAEGLFQLLWEHNHKEYVKSLNEINEKTKVLKR